jgi:hypothetical protein
VLGPEDVGVAGEGGVRDATFFFAHPAPNIVKVATVMSTASRVFFIFASNIFHIALRAEMQSCPDSISSRTSIY